jgi:hypothetical protein
MFNMFVLKRYSALILSSFIPTIMFVVGIQFYTFIMALVLFFVGMLITLIIGNVMLQNPFSAMLDGKGLLVLDLNSTGVIQPVIFGIEQPYVKGKIKGKEVVDVYDRETVQQLSEPIKGGIATIKDSKISFELDKDTFNKGRFGMYNYPVLLYNSQLNTLITKDFLSESEKQAFAEHGVLYLNRKLEELTSSTRDFGRYVVELFKPKEGGFLSGLLGNWVFWVMIIGGIILLVLFGPQIYHAIMGTKETVSGAVSNAITPTVKP